MIVFKNSSSFQGYVKEITQNTRPCGVVMIWYRGVVVVVNVKQPAIVVLVGLCSFQFEFFLLQFNFISIQFNLIFLS